MRYALPAVVLFCLAAGPATKPATQSVPPMSAETQRIVARLKKENDTLKAENKVMGDEITRLRAALAAVPKAPLKPAEKSYKQGDDLETGMTREQVKQATGDTTDGIKKSETETTVLYLYAYVSPVMATPIGAVGGDVDRWYCTFDKQTGKLIRFYKQ